MDVLRAEPEGKTRRAPAAGTRPRARIRGPLPDQEPAVLHHDGSASEGPTGSRSQGTARRGRRGARRLGPAGGRSPGRRREDVAVHGVGLPEQRRGVDGRDSGGQGAGAAGGGPRGAKESKWGAGRDGKRGEEENESREGG